MTFKRGFEVAKGFQDEGINLPKRSTKNSAGYDVESAEDVVIPSIWKVFTKAIMVRAKERFGLNETTPYVEAEINGETNPKLMKPTLVKTGVKAYMQEDEALFLYNRSSNPLKRFLLLGNGVGIVDSDYYNNPDNDGHIMFQFINFGLFDVTIKKGERIGQAVFQKYLKADNDLADGERTSGFGSTGK